MGGTWLALLFAGTASGIAIDHVAAARHGHSMMRIDPNIPGTGGQQPAVQPTAPVSQPAAQPASPAPAAKPAAQAGPPPDASVGIMTRKATPGAPCSSHDKCATCVGNRFCRWQNKKGACMQTDTSDNKEDTPWLIDDCGVPANIPASVVSLQGAVDPEYRDVPDATKATSQTLSAEDRLKYKSKPLVDQYGDPKYHIPGSLEEANYKRDRALNEQKTHAEHLAQAHADLYAHRMDLLGEADGTKKGVDPIEGKYGLGLGANPDAALGVASHKDAEGGVQVQEEAQEDSTQFVTPDFKDDVEENQESQESQQQQQQQEPQQEQEKEREVKEDTQRMKGVKLAPAVQE